MRSVQFEGFGCLIFSIQEMAFGIMADSNLRILMTSPSLKGNVNVSGISSVVRGIISGVVLAGLRLEIRTIIVGRKDAQAKSFLWLLQQVLVPFRFLGRLLLDRPQLVHVNGPLNALAIVRDLLLVMLAAGFNYKVVFHVHGGSYVHEAPRNIILVKLIKIMLGGANVVIVLGSNEAISLARLYSISRDKIVSIPNAVDVPSSFPVRAMGKKLHLIFMGRLVEEKGLRVLVDALVSMRRSTQNFDISIYGAGPLKSHVINVLRPALGEDFYFGGVVNGKEKDQVFSEADVLLLPSLSGEGLPMVLLEAMAMGVVAVATPDGSIPELLVDRVNGILVDKNSVESLSRALVDLLQRKTDGELNVLAAAGHETVAASHSLSLYVTKLFDIYKALLG